MSKSSIAVDLNFCCGWLNPSFLALTGLHEPVNQQMQNQCKDIIFLIKTLSQQNSVLFNTILLLSVLRSVAGYLLVILVAS